MMNLIQVQADLALLLSKLRMNGDPNIDAAMSSLMEAQSSVTKAVNTLAQVTSASGSERGEQAKTAEVDGR